jgi:hypothetical protein
MPTNSSTSSLIVAILGGILFTGATEVGVAGSRYEKLEMGAGSGEREIILLQKPRIDRYLF